MRGSLMFRSGPTDTAFPLLGSFKSNVQFHSMGTEPQQPSHEVENPGEAARAQRYHCPSLLGDNRRPTPFFFA